MGERGGDVERGERVGKDEKEGGKGGSIGEDNEVPLFPLEGEEANGKAVQKGC